MMICKYIGTPKSDTFGMTFTPGHGWSPYCSCGWMQTGWPTANLAQKTLDLHREQEHSDAP